METFAVEYRIQTMYIYPFEASTRKYVHSTRELEKIIPKNENRNS